MNFFLKILNETRSGNGLKVNGSSGMLYQFVWDGLLRAYRYQPKNQDQVDDLYRTMGRTTSYVFCPVNAPVAAPAIEVPKEIADTALELCYQIERSGASEELTKCSVLASKLVTSLTALVTPNAVMPTIPATPANQLKEKLDDSLVEQCLHRNLIVTNEDSNEIASRLISAFDKGSVEALNSPGLKKKKSA